MAATQAVACCTALVAALLIIERRSSPSVSAAVWVPTIWIVIAGSRPLGAWLSPAALPIQETAEAGSALDRFVLSLLITIGLAICFKRGVSWRDIAGENTWLLAVFLYMALSITWSDFPLVSFKRWIRAVGPVIMAGVILSEHAPLEGFKAVARRAAYVLIPFSLLLIKYFPSSGVEYNPWNGRLMWIGVATQKNGLAQVCAVSILLLFWMAITSRSATGRGRRLRVLADLLVVMIALFMLRGPAGAYSATSITVLAVGVLTLVLVYAFGTLGRTVMTRLEIMITFAVCAYWLCAKALIGPIALLLGRDETLTGRREIWDVLLEIAGRRPWTGVGYGGFWGLHPEISAQLQVNQSHSGYLSVYLELGIVGLVLLAMFVAGLSRTVRQRFDALRDLSVLAACCLIMTLLYNISESAFLTGGFLWTTMILVTLLTSHGTPHAEANVANLAPERQLGVGSSSIKTVKCGRGRPWSAGLPAPVEWQQAQDLSSRLASQNDPHKSPGV